MSRTQPLQATVDGLTYSMDHWWEGGPWARRHAGYAEVSFSDIPVLSAKSDQKFSLNEAFRQAVGLQQLVTFLTDRTSGWLRITVTSGADDERGSGEVYLPLSPLGDRHEQAHGSHFSLFDLGDYRFADLVPAWLETWRRLSAACGVYFATRSMHQVHLENQVLTAVTTAEAMCAVLIPQRRFSASLFRCIRDKAVGAVSNEYQDWLRTQIQNWTSLQDRLVLLVERLPERIKTSVFRDPREWAKLSVKARNQVAHEGRLKLDTGLVDAVTRVTEAVVVLTLMNELGCGEAQMTRALRQSATLGALKMVSIQFPELGMRSWEPGASLDDAPAHGEGDVTYTRGDVEHHE